MKKINTFQLAMTFAGCFLGAGYVSGQELWQFFGSFGKSGLLGLIVAMALLFLFGVILLSLAKKSGITDMTEIVIAPEIPWLRAIVGVAEVVLLFGVAVIMAAGTASLLEELLGIPRVLGGGIFCGMVLLTSFFGLDGMIRTFGYVVPVLVCCTVLIGVYTFITYGFHEIPEVSGQNPLLSGWLLSAGTYVSYNLFGSIGILTPLGKRVDNGRHLRGGILLGTGILTMIAVSILGALWTVPEAAEQTLPMLWLACQMGSVTGYLYAALLFAGMFGTALSSTVAADVYLKQKILFFRRHRLPAVGIICCLTWLGSLFGFSELIGVIYPVFGYFGIAALVCIAVHFFRELKKKA